MMEPKWTEREEDHWLELAGAYLSRMKSRQVATAEHRESTDWRRSDN